VLLAQLQLEMQYLGRQIDESDKLILEIAKGMDSCRRLIDPVKIKGTSKRQKKPQILAPEKFQELVSILREPYKTMAIVAMCTGLRVSEVLALRWEHIDFEARAMLVQQGVVNGRIGKVKAEASQDDVPLDPAFADVFAAIEG
jgi:integrase